MSSGWPVKNTGTKIFLKVGHEAQTYFLSFYRQKQVMSRKTKVWKAFFVEKQVNKGEQLAFANRGKYENKTNKSEIIGDILQ